MTRTPLPSSLLMPWGNTTSLLEKRDSQKKGAMANEEVTKLTNNQAQTIRGQQDERMCVLVACKNPEVGEETLELDTQWDVIVISDQPTEVVGAETSLQMFLQKEELTSLVRDGVDGISGRDGWHLRIDQKKDP